MRVLTSSLQSLDQEIAYLALGPSTSGAVGGGSFSSKSGGKPAAGKVGTRQPLPKKGPTAKRAF